MFNLIFLKPFCFIYFTCFHLFYVTQIVTMHCSFFTYTATQLRRPRERYFFYHLHDVPSHACALWSARFRADKPPSNRVRGQSSTICFIVWIAPQLQAESVDCIKLTSWTTRYLSKLTVPVHRSRNMRRLRSSDTLVIINPDSRNKFDERGFTVFTPST